MPFFPVDDRFHSHPKAAAASLAALGLWAVAGSWANDHLTDGDVPEHMIPLLSRGATELADELVDVGLWRRTKAGYRFHQWHSDGDGSHRNISRSEVSAMREKKSSGGTLGNHRRWHAARGVVDPACDYCASDTDRTGVQKGFKSIGPPMRKRSEGGRAADNGSSDAVSDDQRRQPSDTDRTSDRTSDTGSDATPNPPTPPHPTPSSGIGGGVAHGGRQDHHPPPERCPAHIAAPADGPCGPCGDARRERQAWEQDNARRAAAEQSTRARERAELRQREIGNCKQGCDNRGYLPSGRVCHHKPPSRVGAAAAREALNRARSDPEEAADAA